MSLSSTPCELISNIGTKVAPDTEYIRPPDIRPTIWRIPDIRPVIRYLPKNIILVLVKNQVFFTHFFFQFSSVSK